MSGDMDKLGKDRSVTVRFSSHMMNNIDDLAREYRVTRSDIIRLATDNALERFLNHVRYVDSDQGQLINNHIVKLGNTLSESLYNMKRLGNNFDQLLHKVNAGQIQELQAREELIRREELDAIISRMERVTKEIGGALSVFKN